MGRKPSSGTDVAGLIRTGNALQAQGRIDESIKYLERVLRAEPGNPDAIHLISMGLLRQLRNAEAAKFLRKWATHPASRNAATQYYIAYSYFVAKRYKLALQHLETSLALEPGRVITRILIARSLIGSGKPKAALEFLHQGLDIETATPENRKTYATVLSDLKQYDEARQVLTRLLHEDFDPVGRAYDLIELPPETWSSETCEQVTEFLNLPDLSAREKTLLHFAAGRIADHQARYRDAFNHFIESKKNSTRNLDLAAYRRAAKACMNGPAAPVGKTGTQLKQGQKITPLFVFGLPRSGKTLLEQLLSQRPEFAACGEVQSRHFIDADVFVATSGKVPDQYEHLLKNLKSTQCDMYANQYIDGVSEQYSLPNSTKFIINTMPHNYFNIRTLKLIFPHGKFIFVRRELNDLFIFNLMKNFKYKYSFVRDFNAFSQYYSLVEELISHWQRRADPNFLVVEYADIVKSPERTVNRIHQFLEVDLSSGNQSATETEKPDLTDDFIGYWRHYRDLFPPAAADTAPDSDPSVKNLRSNNQRAG